MKAKAEKILLLLSLTVLLIGVTGCGPNTVTTVNLNEDMSGERVMEMYMSSEDQEEWILTDVDTMDAVVAENCPEELEYSMVEAEDGSGHTFYFTLKFDSIEDYEEKMTALAGKDVTVDVQIADTVFSSGIYIKEDCYSSELLSWLPDVLVDNDIVEESNSSYVLNNSTTAVIYNEQQYTSWLSGKLDIHELNSISLNGINIYSTLEGEDILRKIEVDIPSSSYEVKGTEIEEYLNAHVPAGATGEMVDGDYGNKLFTITIPKCSLADMEEAMKTFSDSDEVEISIEDASTNAKYGIASRLHEKLDLTSYISNDPNRVYSRYLVSDNVTVDEVERICGDDTTTNYPYELNDYYEISSAYAVEYELNSTIVRLYRPYSMTVVTDVAKDGTITHSFEMGFAEDILEQDKELLLENAQTDLPEKMSASWGTGDKGNLIVFKISGTAKELQDILGDYLDKYELAFDKDTSFIKPKQSYDFSCMIDISKLADGGSFNSASYVFHMPGDVSDASADKKISYYDLDGKLSENVYTVTTESAVCKVYIEGSVLNILGIIVIAVIAIIVVALIVFVIMMIIKKNKQKKAALANGIPMQPQMPGQAYGMPMQPQMPGMENGMPMQPQMPGMESGMPMQPQMPGMEDGMPVQPQMPGMENGMPMQPQMPGMENGMPVQPQMPGMEDGMPVQPQIPGMEDGMPAQPEVLTDIESVSAADPVVSEANESASEQNAMNEAPMQEANFVGKDDTTNTVNESEISQEPKQFCPQCGNEIEANAAFCENCGMRIKELI